MKQFKYIFILLAAWLCGLVCCQVAITLRSSKEVIPGPSAKQQQHSITALEKNYQQQADSLQQKQHRLTTQLQEKEKQLTTVTHNNNRLQGKLQYIILQQKQLQLEKDTVALVAHCDTLLAQTTNYITATNYKDSMQESIVLLQKEQLGNKDSLLTIKETQNQSLKQIANNSIQRQQYLEQLTVQQNKTIHKQKLGATLKNIGLVILSGLLVKQTLQ